MKLYIFLNKVRSAMHRCFSEPIIKNAFAHCGKNVRVPQNCYFSGVENVFVGNNVAFGRGNTVLSTRAKLIIGDDVMFGPNVTIVTGDHRTDMIGRTMISVKDCEKLPENDQDVIIEKDVWIGANVTILKGVTIHTGSVIAAGAVVTTDIPPCQIWGGIPAHYLTARFSDEDLQKHIDMLK